MLILLTAPCLFYFTYLGIKDGIVLSLIGYMLSNGFLCAALYYFLYLQLPPHIRCRGVSTIWALAASVGALALPFLQQAVFTYQMASAPGILVDMVVMAALLTILYNLKQQKAALKPYSPLENMGENQA